MTEPVWTEKSVGIQWERPAFSGSQSVDSYISDCTEAYSETLKLMEDTEPVYKIYTTYLETASGEACKAVSIRIDDEERLNDGDYLDISQEYQACQEELQRLRKLDADLAGLGLSYVNAGLGLPELGLGAIAYGRVLKTGRQTVKACIEAVKEMTAEKQAELSMLETWLRTASVIDGISSTRYTLLCPLAPGETPPDDMLQLLVNFDVR